MFRDLPELLDPGDLLVLNDTRVIAARVLGRRATGGKIEALFLRDLGGGRWEALLRCNGKPRPGEWIQFADGALQIRLLDRGSGGAWVVATPRGSLVEKLERLGQVPLPPYIHREPDDPRLEADRTRYQTVYASEPGAIAAPTAGLHFTEGLLERLAARGVALTRVTLHVGVGTFRPITSEDIRDHHMHSEAYSVSTDAVAHISDARRRGARIIPVGTTACRVLETLARDGLTPRTAETDIYITPPYSFGLADAIVTNFHLPRSTLLVMIAAFAGRERILKVYQECRDKGYRFYSYGDAMLIT